MFASIFWNVVSACWKKSYTMLLLNSRSSSSSSISRICSKVAVSMLSPNSGRPVEPSSLCATSFVSLICCASWMEGRDGKMLHAIIPCMLKDVPSHQSVVLAWWSIAKDASIVVVATLSCALQRQPRLCVCVSGEMGRVVAGRLNVVTPRG